MSPEQILGDKLDFRSRHVLARRRALPDGVRHASRSSRTSTKSVMHKIRLEKYPSPRASSIREIPRELERIIDRCMEKRKDDRYQSTQDLVLALERFISQARRDELSRAARAVPPRPEGDHRRGSGRAASSGGRRRVLQAGASGAARMGGDEAAGVGAGGDSRRAGGDHRVSCMRRKLERRRCRRPWRRRPRRRPDSCRCW